MLVEVKARVLPSGDQMGEELPQEVSPLGVMSFSVAGSGCSTLERCSVDSPLCLTVQATVVPSGEMEANSGMLALV